MRSTTHSPLAITVDDVAASWIAHRGKPASARMSVLIARLLGQIDSQGGIEPQISFRVWKIIEKSSRRFHLDGGLSVCSSTLGHYLPGATHLAAAVCTIGAGIGKHVSEALAEMDYLKAVLLDHIGTVALFRLGNRLETVVRADAIDRNLDAGRAFNPGEDGLEISLQTVIVQLADGGSVGISIANTGMLKPRKSLSILMGLAS